METKGVTCKIPLDLHNQISEEIRETESTMSKFIEMVIREHYEKGANKIMEKGRTLAFQLSEELFKRVKEYLENYEKADHRRVSHKEFVIGLIEKELEERIRYFKGEDKLLEAQRIAERTNFDIEMLRETGFCSGIENYSRHLNGMEAGAPPYTLLDFFKDDFLIIIDESHITIPQIRGMYAGDRSRKQTLVDYGFRLPSALDNRPLNFEEFESHIDQMLFVSATPNVYEAEHELLRAEQIIRPTGLLDPKIDVRPVEGQIDDLIGEVRKETAKHNKILITTLTKRMAEALTDYMRDAGTRVH